MPIRTFHLRFNVASTISRCHFSETRQRLRRMSAFCVGRVARQCGTHGDRGLICLAAPPGSTFVLHLRQRGAQVEGHLEEMLLLCQRSEEYNQFMLAKMADAVAPAILGANRENAFRCARPMGAQLYLGRLSISALPQASLHRHQCDKGTFCLACCRLCDPLARIRMA